MLPDIAGSPTLCLITDRRRLMAVVGHTGAPWQPLLLDQIRGAVHGGVDVVQIRERDIEAGVLADFVRRCIEELGAARTRVIVNDRLDVALAAGAHGVHLREDGVLPAAARRIVPPGFIVGRSIHGAEAAGSSPGADYLIAGSVFETASKPGSPAGLGLDGLESTVRAAAPVPVWAVGGVDRTTISAVLARGARGIAAIGAFLPATRVHDVAKEVQQIASGLRFRFDTAERLS